MTLATGETDIQRAARLQDDRPQRGGWAPGNYLCICARCADTFFGDKRAMECAPCAYASMNLEPPIVDWIKRQIDDAKDEMSKVSAEHAHSVAFNACTKTLRAVGGL